MKRSITLSILLLIGIVIPSRHLHAQSCTPVTIPYAENLNGASFSIPNLPACTEVADADGDGYTWKTGKYPGEPLRTGKSLHAHGQQGTTAALADDWFYTEGLQLKGDSLYRLRFSFTGLGATAGGTGTGVAAFDVWWGSAKNADSMRVNPALFDTTDLAGNLMRLDTVFTYFKPGRTGTWYIGFHSKIRHSADIYADDILLERAPANYVKDLQMTAITEPADSLRSCPDTHVTVRIAVMNMGIDTFESIPLFLSTTGPATHTYPVLLNRRLAPGAADTAEFTGVDLSVPGDHVLSVYHGLAGDEHPDNDTLKNMFLVEGEPAADSIIITPSGALSYDFVVVNARHVMDYDWDFGDGNTATGPSVTHTYPSDGNYAITLTVSNDCGSDMLSGSVDTRVKVRETAFVEDHVSIYPNPAQEMVTIRHDNVNIKEIAVYNNTGMLVYHADEVTDDCRIATGQWAAGLYLIHIRTFGGTMLYKLEVSK